jgi:hypothetical protein
VEEVLVAADLAAGEPVHRSPAAVLGVRWRIRSPALRDAVRRQTLPWQRGHACFWYPVGRSDPNHDARMRIGGEAPRRWTHS